MNSDGELLIVGILVAVWLVWPEKKAAAFPANRMSGGEGGAGTASAPPLISEPTKECMCAEVTGGADYPCVCDESGRGTPIAGPRLESGALY